MKQITDDDTAWDEGLKGRNRNFVIFYCTDPDCFMNGRRSYLKAFSKYKAGERVWEPSVEVADAASSRLLRNVKVKNSCRALLRLLQPDVDTDNATKLLHDLAVQAMYNPADIIDDTGDLVKPLKEMGDLAKCVNGIQWTKYGKKVILVDRTRAQRNLLEYYNLVRELPEHDVGLPITYLVPKAESIEEWNKENESK